MAYIDEYGDRIVDSADLGYPGVRLAVRETDNDVDICGRRLERAQGETVVGEIVGTINIASGTFGEGMNEAAKREIALDLARATAWNEDRSWHPETMALLRTQVGWRAVKELVLPYLPEDNELDTIGDVPGASTEA